MGTSEIRSADCCRSVTESNRDWSLMDSMDFYRCLDLFLWSKASLLTLVPSLLKYSGSLSWIIWRHASSDFSSLCGCASDGFRDVESV